MFSRLWRSNQIILCAISGGSLEKLTYWRAICFLRFRGFFSGCSGFSWGVPGFFWGVPGFLRGVPGFLGVFLVFRLFRNVPWCSGVPVFRCSWKYYMPLVSPLEANSWLIILSQCDWSWQLYTQLRSFHWNRTYTEIFLKLCQLIVYIIGT